MKKFLRRTLRVLLVVIVLAGGFFAYIWFSSGGNRNAFSVIPEDAIYIIETTKLTDGWNDLTKSKIWKNVIQTDFFADVNEDATYMDEMIKGNPALETLLKNRQLLISAHIIPGTDDYDFLIVIDVEKASKMTFIVDLLEVFGTGIEKNKYKDIDVITLGDSPDDYIYLAIVDNLLITCYNKELIEKSIDCKDNDFWEKNDSFQAVTKRIEKDRIFNFYFNYAQIDSFMKCYLEEDSDLMKSLGDALLYSAFNLSMGNDALTLTGYTSWNDTVPSYLKIIGNSSPAKYRAYEILPENTAFYMALNFSDFKTFHSNLEKEFRTDKENDNDIKQVEKIEKLMGISFKEDFFSWIGSEIAFIKLEPKTNEQEKDVVAAIHAKDIKKAKEGLGKIMKKVKRRTPGKFKESVYKEYSIYYLEINGFFKLFLGKLFRKLDKPYFVYIEDYVFFSNSPSSLYRIIDNYMIGKTLSHNDAFMKFKKNFKPSANISVFVQMASTYKLLYRYGDKESKESIQKNKNVIMSFSHIGYQMTSDGTMFETKLFANHNADSYVLEDLDKMEEDAEKTMNMEIEALDFKVKIYVDEEFFNSPQKLYYDSEQTIVEAEGMLKNGETDGLWRSYYKSGNISSAVNYENGELNGQAIFYFDNNEKTIKAKADFESDLMEGVYYEYYSNGAQKAKINYINGSPHGRAEYFYESGASKILGKYKNGKKTGKWKFYNEAGQLYDKVKDHGEEEE
jgi:antitoxin component YwqK of YwqJK toxin-antitoxin module